MGKGFRFTSSSGSKSRTAKLTHEKAQAIWDAKGQLHITEAVKRFGVSRNCINNVWRGVSWPEIDRGRHNPS